MSAGPRRTQSPHCPGRRSSRPAHLAKNPPCGASLLTESAHAAFFQIVDGHPDAPLLSAFPSSILRGSSLARLTHPGEADETPWGSVCFSMPRRQANLSLASGRRARERSRQLRRAATRFQERDSIMQSLRPRLTASRSPARLLAAPRSRERGFGIQSCQWRHRGRRRA
jgi:hypothetical protein